MFKCPYCDKNTMRSGLLFTSWLSVRSHTAKCTKNSGIWYIDKVIGPIHYSTFNDLNRKEIFSKLPWLTVKNLGDIRKSFLKRNIKITCYEDKRTDEERLKPIHEFFNKHGRIPGYRDIKQGQGIKKWFGSWNKAIELAGYCPIKNINGGQGGIQLKKSYTDENLLDILVDFYKKYDRSPKCEEFNNSDYPSHSTYRDRFGSWNNSLILAGLPINITSYSVEELLELGKKWILLNKRNPSHIDFGGTLPSVSTILKYFDSWKNYVSKIGGNIEEFSYTKFGHQTIGLDGNLYRSKLEAILANWFYSNNIEYEYETSYPKPYYLYYDFYLTKQNIYIELDGMLDARPNKIIEEKIEINKLLNRKLLVLYPKDVKYPETKLSTFLNV